MTAAASEEIIKAVRRRWPWLKHLFADGAHDRGRLASLAACKDLTLAAGRKLPNRNGFQMLPLTPGQRVPSTAPRR